MKYIPKGVALVERNGFVLLVSKKGNIFSLPGGICKKNESKLDASYRELYEETGLLGISSEKFLSYTGDVRQRNGIRYRKSANVYIIEAKGKAVPQNEITKLYWWRPGESVRVSRQSRNVLEKYFSEYID